jgi:hypothetical protein
VRPGMNAWHFIHIVSRTTTSNWTSARTPWFFFSSPDRVVVPNQRARACNHSQACTALVGAAAEVTGGPTLLWRPPEAASDSVADRNSSACRQKLGRFLCFFGYTPALPCCQMHPRRWAGFLTRRVLSHTRLLVRICAPRLVFAIRVQPAPQRPGVGTAAPNRSMRACMVMLLAHLMAKGGASSAGCFKTRRAHAWTYLSITARCAAVLNADTAVLLDRAFALGMVQKDQLDVTIHIHGFLTRHALLLPLLRLVPHSP